MPTFPNSTPIFLDGRAVAYARGRLLDVRRRPNGLLKLPEPALALSVTVLASARALGCRSILLSVASGGRFEISLPDFLAHGFEVKRSGFEKQIGCALSRFTSDLDPKSAPKQPALFEGGAR